MRTTLQLDEDVLAAARALAERKGRTLGEVVGAGMQGPGSGRRAAIPQRHPPDAGTCGCEADHPGRDQRAARRGAVVAVSRKATRGVRDARVEWPAGKTTWLLALTVRHGGKLATFDRRLVTVAVKGGDQAVHAIAG